LPLLFTDSKVEFYFIYFYVAIYLHIFFIIILGSHTYDVIAQRLDAIIHSFRLEGKVVSIVTDNGSNFVKAFTEYGRPAEEEDQPDDSAEPVDYDYESCNESDTETTTAQSAADFLEAFDGDDDDFGDDEDTPRRITLPPHFRCAAHTLNLLASSDFDRVLTSHQAYKKVFRKVMGKLHALWNSNGRSALTADLTYETLGRYLPRPVTTRWNSLFDCLSVLTFQDPEKINQLLSALNIPHVSNDEHSFIIQYLSIMAPIACALDVLQGENNCFLGCVLPVLVKVKSKLLSLTLKRDQSHLFFLPCPMMISLPSMSVSLNLAPS